MSINEAIAKLAKRVSSDLCFWKQAEDEKSYPSSSSSSRTALDKQQEGDPEEVLKEAVEWASLAWRSVFFALQARSHENGIVRQGVEDDPAYSVVRGLTLRYLKNPAQAVSYVKENIAYLVAKILGQEELPEFSDAFLASSQGQSFRGVLGGGWVFRMCKRLMRQPLEEDESKGDLVRKLSIASDILYSKFGRGRVSEKQIDATKEKHWKTLTEPHSVSDEGLRKQIRERIQSVVPRLFRNRTFSPGLFMPSMNACFEASRSSGGSLEELFEKALAHLTDDAKCSLYDLDDPSGPSFRVDVCDGGVHRVVHIPAVGLDFLPTLLSAVEDSIADDVYAEPVAIPEPDKVRMITKMSAAHAYATLCLQKFMHQVVSSYPAFEFIGKPIDEESFSKHFKSIGPDEIFVSGDYTAATDNLDPTLSEAVWDAICDEVEDGEGKKLRETSWYELGRKCLTHHILSRKVGRKGETEEKGQMWGQLMGSPMSFPILCIVNFCASSLGMGLPEEYAWKCGPIVVNGDDLAAICRRDKYTEWARYVTAAGLKPSLGKNYTSRRFLVMNSEMRLAEGPLDSVIFWSKVGFLNQSLLFGLEKKGIDAGKSIIPEMDFWEMGDRCRELLETDRLKDRRAWRSWFLDQHRPVIQKMPPGASKFASTSLGGAGIPFLPGDPTPGLLERRTATTFAVNEKLRTALRGLQSSPKRASAHAFEFLNSEAEKYYRNFLPVITSSIPEMDLILQNWGFPITRDKSALGAGYRLGYMFKSYFVLRRMGHERIRKPERKPDWFPDNERLLKLVPAGAGGSWDWAQGEDLGGGLTEKQIARKIENQLNRRLSFSRQNAVLRVFGKARRLQNSVVRHDGELEELLGPEGLPSAAGYCCECDGHHIHPVAPATFVKWRAPEEDLVQWDSLPHISPRILGFVNPGSNSAAKKQLAVSSGPTTDGTLFHIGAAEQEGTRDDLWHADEEEWDLFNPLLDDLPLAGKSPLDLENTRWYLPKNRLDVDRS